MRAKLALFNHHPECSIDCCNGMVEALAPDYRVDLFTKEQFNRVILKDYAAVMFPGGIGDSHTHYNFFTRRYRDWETDRKSTRLNSSH